MLRVHWYRRSTLPEDAVYSFRPQWQGNEDPAARSWVEVSLTAIGWVPDSTNVFCAEETPEEMILEADRIMSAEFGEIYHRTSVPNILRPYVLLQWQPPMERGGYVGLKVAGTQRMPDYKRLQMENIFTKLGGKPDLVDESTTWFPFRETGEVYHQLREEGFNIDQVPPKGILFKWLGGYAPVQAEGWVDGLPFYFRARGPHWELRIAAVGGDPIASPEWVYGEAYGKEPVDASYMPLDEAEELIRSTIARYLRGEPPKPSE